MVGKVAALTDFERFQSRITKICPYGVFFLISPSPLNISSMKMMRGGQLKQTGIYVSLDILVSVVRMARVV